MEYKEFEGHLNNIRKFAQDGEKIANNLNQLLCGDFIVSYGERLLEGYVQSLESCFNNKDEAISWWLFDGGTLWEPFKTSHEVIIGDKVWNIKTDLDLYNYLKENV